MAKRKRAAHEKPFSRSSENSETLHSETPTTVDATATAVAEPESSADADVAEQFVGQWNQLISTSNWEKGQIICEWREALIASDAEVTDYSDEAWAQLVGGVTSQHVGRLRRVSQRFGDVSTQYAGLYWSHFQACLDWDDAEMWLEGSIQNKWSVSQMRGKRWETLGTTPEDQAAETTQAAAELSTEAEVEESSAQSTSADQEAPFDSDTDSLSLSPSHASIDSLGEATNDSPSSSNDEPATEESADPVSKRTRLSVDVESLPDDLAEAFESFKLAIIAHRRENWRDTTPESVVECLDALKELALAEN